MNNDRDLMQELSAQGAKMTDKELLQEALERLLAWKEESSEYGWSLADEECVEALRARLSQPEQEPVAWCIVENGRVHGLVKTKPAVMNAERWQPLYTTPPQREWVGLTDEEMMQIYVALKSVAGFYSVEKYARAIEVNLKEKNSAD